MMRKAACLVVVLSAAILSAGCVLEPFLFTSRTEVVRAEDATTVFGDRFSFRILEEDVFAWWDGSRRL
jgi:hypothetical protein